jgi:hypothetical protein
MKTYLVLFQFIFVSLVFGQEDIAIKDSMMTRSSAPVSVYTSDYMRKYNRIKKRVVKVYPYALFAADMIDEIENRSQEIEKRRKKNKFYKNAYSDLKANFKYFILDLYTSEGAMLMKLVSRESGMSVYEIAEKFQGKGKAEMFAMMAKIWDQDLKVTFTGESEEDKIINHVIFDIESGLIDFNEEIVIVDKSTYKESQIAYKERVKENHKRQKELRKLKRKSDREIKRKERKIK